MNPPSTANGPRHTSPKTSASSTPFIPASGGTTRDPRAAFRIPSEWPVSVMRSPAESLYAPEALDPFVGAVIDRWRVSAPLGKGGIGTVYRAEPSDGGKQVAFKVLQT